MSFGMIFSIILIIVFIAFAFYAIRVFLNISDSAKIGKAIDKINNDVDKIWKSAQASEEFSYVLPTKVKYLCFADTKSSPKGSMRNFYKEIELFSRENQNMFFYPMSGLNTPSYELKNINLEEITKTQNPYCIENKNGQIKLRLEKKFAENLVRISG